jgi:hypothetical protein
MCLWCDIYSHQISSGLRGEPGLPGLKGESGTAGDFVLQGKPGEVGEPGDYGTVLYNCLMSNVCKNDFCLVTVVCRFYRRKRRLW